MLGLSDDREWSLSHRPSTLASQKLLALASTCAKPPLSYALAGARDPWERVVASFVGFDIRGRKHVALPAILKVKHVRLFTDVLTVLYNVLILPLPGSDAMSGLLLLKPLENCLVLERYPEKLSLPLLPIQRWLRLLLAPQTRLV